jgi:transposase-like protein
MQSKYSRSQPLESKVAWYRCRESGMSVGEICELFGMSRNTYYKWYKRYQEEGVAGGLPREGTLHRRAGKTLPYDKAARTDADMKTRKYAADCAQANRSASLFSSSSRPRPGPVGTAIRPFLNSSGFLKSEWSGLLMAL